MKPEADANEIICPSCLAPNERFAQRCRSCGAPIGTTATLDPIQSISTQGFVFRKALEGRPKPIVLAGLWLMFFPVLLGSLYAATYLMLHRTSFAEFFFFWAFVGLAYVAFVVLYRVTRNYLMAPGKIDSIDSIDDSE